ncbi:hypothetical protein BB560_000282 [Smittium megazygosporum]|uniref:Uncharacterized protein n=1 Tax=Smittium megazygosporum TaxID=133381 RepID=A0A2T9ZKR7_9FUNG|nr:hypothetical protein BB560_000282 [Smittium megazygosporum]
MHSLSEKSYRESQTAISGLGRRVGQLDAGQTENTEYQGTKPDQSPHNLWLLSLFVMSFFKDLNALSNGQYCHPSPVLIKNHELASDSNLLEYIEDFKKAEYIAKFIGTKSEYNLGKPHLQIFCILPENFFSKLRASKNAFHKNWSSEIYFESVKLDSIVRAAISSKNSYSLQNFDYIIRENFHKDASLFLEKKSVFIEDAFSYASKKDPEFLNSLMLLLQSDISFGEKYMGSLRKFRIFNIKSKSEIAREFLRDFVLKGQFQALNEDSFEENECLAYILLKNQEKFSIPDNVFYTALPSYLYLFITLHGYALSNFLIDISLNPYVFKQLEKEQKKIISKYGEKITTKSLNQMVYLDAAITESFRLGSNNMSMKQSLQDIILPNGVFMPKASFVKFNSITHNRSSEIFKNQPHDFIPERHFFLGNKLNKISITNLTWGLGRECPYRKLCSATLKLFSAILIRNYRISQNDANQNITHDGYFFDYIVQHAKTSTLQKYSMDIDNTIMQQDNYLKHTAKITKIWLSTQKVNTLYSPLKSPGINPMKNCWGYTKNIISKKYADILKEGKWWKIFNEYKRIPRSYIKKLTFQLLYGLKH